MSTSLTLIESILYFWVSLSTCFVAGVIALNVIPFFRDSNIGYTAISTTEERWITSLVITIAPLAFAIPLFEVYELLAALTVFFIHHCWMLFKLQAKGLFQ
jgi:hypothetical protein